MAQNDIDDLLDHLTRIKCGGNLSTDWINHIEIHETQLRLLRTFIRYHHIPSPESLVKITKMVQFIVEDLHWVFDRIPVECKTNLNLERVALTLLESIEGNRSLRNNSELNDSDLSEYMDCLDKTLNDILMYWECFSSARPVEYVYIMNSLRKQLKIVQKKMRFLRYLYVSEINGYVDHEQLEGLEARIQLLADNVGDFCVAFLNILFGGAEDQDIEGDEEKDIVSKPPYLLCLIVLVQQEMKKIFHCELKASKFTQSRTFKDNKLPKGFSDHLHSLLMYLRIKKFEYFPNNVSAQNIDGAIEFLLVFLDADVSNHVINGNWLNEVMEKVGAIAGDVLYVIQKLLPRSINEDNTSKIKICSIQILEKTKDLKAPVETYYKSLKFTPSQFPTVVGLSFLDSLLRKLNEMLKSESGFVFLMKPDIGNLEKKLSSLTSNLEKELSSLSAIFRDFAKVQHEHENLKDLQRRTINLACEAEVAIDSILAHYNAFWHIFCSLPTILKEIEHINAEMTETWSADAALKPCYVVAPTKHLPTQHSNPVNDEEIVGFENDTKEIIQYLIKGKNKLDVVPIVGMAGQGKTTIARKVYNSGSIVSHFDVRAWCIISQTYNRRELLQEIFDQVPGTKDKGDEDDILADKLRKRLMGKRYLIVLDDMWDGMAWDDLSPCFPDFGNRSRIVVTTRLKKVGEYVKHLTDPYPLPFLTPDESLNLLQKKVFQQESCPPELQDVSQAVAERCKGLPLVIVLVAGIIKTKKMEASQWREVKDSLLSSLGGSEDYSLSTMQLSYANLPDYLRPCLLHMGMFPEDARIPVSKLISLWIAEGFVQNIESGRLMEEAAESYLMDLISSNVVMVSERRCNGEVKYCQVHDVVLHFCLKRSSEENFMLAVKGDESQFQPSDWNESRVSFTYGKEFASLGSKTQNLFHYQHLRSLITTHDILQYGWKPFHRCSKLRLVKVLDLSSFDVGLLSLATLNPLIHLKYLAVKTIEFEFHPESLLPHLETLLVTCRGKCVKLPASFWKMKKLRHVEITEAVFDLEEDKQGIFEESFKLENLRILKGVNFLIDGADSVDVLLGRRCPNLQRLEIDFADYDDLTEICLKLKCLSQLQMLYLYSNWGAYTISELHLPSNLKELKLVMCGIEETIPFIAKLPSLEYLKLSDMVLPLHHRWCLEDNTFPKLRVLKLKFLRMSSWDASEKSFPLLEKLVLVGCENLREIPISFVDIPTLKHIELRFWEPNKYQYQKASAMKILEEAEEFEGCNRINLIIKPVQKQVPKYV